jgi:AcrR family transcriptional regulator
VQTTKARLLDAALSRFAERGVTATTLDEIRAHAGASVGSVYHAFPGGKEDIAAELYLATLSDYQRAFAHELRRHADAEQGVKAIVDLHVRWCVRRPAETRFLHAARDAVPHDRLAALNQEFFAETLAWWATHARYGAVRDLPLELVHALWLGPAQELLSHWLAGRARKPTKQTRAILADAAWNALKRSADP